MSKLKSNQKERIKEKFGYRCQVCNVKFHRNKTCDTMFKEKKMWLEIHHIYPQSTHEEFKKNMDYLVPVCRGCHEKVHDSSFTKLTRLGLILREKRLLEIKCGM